MYESKIKIFRFLFGQQSEVNRNERGNRMVTNVTTIVSK